MGTLNIDRYHAAMGDASFKDVTRLHDHDSATPKRLFTLRNANFRSLRAWVTNV